MRTAEDRKNGKWPAANFDCINAMIKWAAGGKEPIGGSREVPWEKYEVGGAILPENVKEVAGVTLQYASNQMPGVMDCVVNRTKEVKDLLDKWLPSPPRRADEYYLSPVAGSGGSGWAINVYTPRSAAVCANDMSSDDFLKLTKKVWSMDDYSSLYVDAATHKKNKMKYRANIDTPIDITDI